MLSQTYIKFTYKYLIPYFMRQLQLEMWLDVYNATVDFKYGIFHNKLMHLFKLG